MKRLFMTAFTVAFIASPAFAFRVTNLDKVAYTVELSGGGQAERRTIEPGDTEYFTGNSNGLLSLVDTKTKGKAKPADDTTVHADGLLSGIIGAERNTNIPTDPANDYAIWPGGKLAIQSSKRAASGNQF